MTIILVFFLVDLIIVITIVGFTTLPFLPNNLGLILEEVENIFFLNSVSIAN